MRSRRRDTTTPLQLQTTPLTPFSGISYPGRHPNSVGSRDRTVDTPDRLDKEFVWVVDPLDGTKEFIEGVPHFVVSVGLVRNGKPALGVLYNPVRDELIQTSAGEGSLYNGEPTRLLRAPELKEVSCVNSRSETRAGLWEPWRETFRELVPIGSVAYKLGLVACGREEFFVTLRPKNEWDLCGGHAILAANGGVLVDLAGEEIVYNKVKPLTEPGLVGGDPALVEKFLEAYREQEST